MKTWMKTCAALCVVALTGWPMAAPAQNTHTLPLVRPAGFAGQESLVRIVNRSATSGTVQVNAIDDTGERFGPVTLTLGALQTVNITSSALERGNAAVGLPVGIGDGSGSWRLELATALAIEPLAYIRTPDGFLTSMHDVAPMLVGGVHWVPFFNPGSNTSKVSHLRIINPGTAAVGVTITGRDDGGDEASGTVRLALAAGEARTLSAQDLESGGVGFTGSLGDGAGKWRLNVRSTTDIQVMSLLSTRTGHLANLSTVSVAPDGSAKPTGATFRDCPGCPVMVVVPAGTFMMGSPDLEVGRDGDEGPAHRVTFDRPYAPFAVGVHEVTRGEFARFVEATSRSMAGCRVFDDRRQRWSWGRNNNWMNPLIDQTDAHPVVCVSWLDAKAYIRWLSGETGETYRLLSEAEWEYVARAGTSTSRYWGESQVGQCRYANGADSGTDYPGRWVGCDDGYEKTAPVGSFEANAFGLHDVMGNVWEWVEDPYHGSYRNAPSDGSVWEGGSGHRMIRGGSWYHGPASLRSAIRVDDDLDDRTSNLGFRVARTLRP